MTEEWEDMGNGYSVSNHGRVQRKDGRLLKAFVVGGHPCVKIRKEGKQWQRLVSQLVAEAFIPLPDAACRYVRHIDGDKTNNRSENLEWVLPKKRKKAGKQIR